jgi:adenylate cyclase class 2
MCIEIEAKLKVDSLQEIERKLVELGADFLAEQLQSDFFFDDVNSTLTKSDRCLRLRKETVGKDERYFLTYKGAKEKSRLKKRQEIEFEIKDADSVRKLLSVLEYEQVLEVEKRRRLWQFNQCKVALDRLPLLGDFVEIEGSDEEKIANAQEKLGLSDLSHIAESYASLVAKKQIVNSK